MIIEVPNNALVAVCGGDWGNESATDIGHIVKTFFVRAAQCRSTQDGVGSVSS